MYVEFTITTILDKNVVTPRPQINVVLRFHVATLNSEGGGWCYNNVSPTIYSYTYSKKLYLQQYLLLIKRIAYIVSKLEEILWAHNFFRKQIPFPNRARKKGKFKNIFSSLGDSIFIAIATTSSGLIIYQQVIICFNVYKIPREFIQQCQSSFLTLFLQFTPQ